MSGAAGRPTVTHAVDRAPRRAGLLGARGEALMAIAIIGAFPTANNVFVYAHRYRSGVTMARDAVIITTVGSLLVILLITVIAQTV